MDPYADDDVKRRKRNFFGFNPDILGWIILSKDGLPIASALPRGVDETKITATIAAMFSLAERSTIELENGDFDILYFKGSMGYLLVFQAGPNRILSVITSSNVRLGLILLECKRICDKIASGNFDDNEGEDGYFPFPTSESERFCKYCGAVLAKGDSICHVCGNKVI